MLQKIEMLHEIGYIHGDVSPENFLCEKNGGIENLYLSGFANLKSFVNENTGEHSPNVLRKCQTSNTRF